MKASHLHVSRDIIDPDLEDNCEYAGGKESIDISETMDLRLPVCNIPMVRSIVASF